MDSKQSSTVSAGSSRRPAASLSSTSAVARSAASGDPVALGRLLQRFTDPLLVLARYRLGRGLKSIYDPEDLVGDVWVRAIPRIHELTPRRGRLTPVIMKFLSRILVNRYNTLLQKHILGKPVRVEAADPVADPMDDIVYTGSGVITRVVRGETRESLQRIFATLAPTDREVVLLRGLEQLTNRQASTILGLDPHAVSMRYSRALKKLVRRLPDSVFAELAADADGLPSG